MINDHFEIFHEAEHGKGVRINTTRPYYFCAKCENRIMPGDAATLVNADSGDVLYCFQCTLLIFIVAMNS